MVPIPTPSVSTAALHRQIQPKEDCLQNLWADSDLIKDWREFCSCIAYSTKSLPFVVGCEYPTSISTSRRISIEYNVTRITRKRRCCNTSNISGDGCSSLDKEVVNPKSFVEVDVTFSPKTTGPLNSESAFQMDHPQS